MSNNYTFTVRSIIYATQENALIGFRHNGTYGKFALLDLEILPASPQTSATAFGKRQISRITGLVGGVDIPYVKNRSTAADLPTAVKIVRRPEQVTLDSAPTYRNLLPFPYSLVTVGLKGWGRHSCADMGIGTWWNAGYGDSNIQRIELTEGQGIAFTSDDANPVFAFTVGLTVVLRNPSSGATYTINTQHHPSEMSGAAFAVLNGSGSGITLEVVSIQVSDIGDAAGMITTPSMVRLLRIYRLIGGKDITAIPSRSDRPVPSFLVLKRNFYADDLTVMYMGDVTGGPNAVEYGYPSTNAPLFWRTGALGRRMLAPDGSANVGLALPFWNPSIRWSKNVRGISFERQDSHFFFGPGEGFAVVQSFNPIISEYYVEMTIEWIPDVLENKAPVVGEYLVKDGGA